MEYYNNTLCVSGSEIILSENNPNGLISKAMWDKLVRGGANVIRRGSFCSPALIDFNTLPQKYRDLITARLGPVAEEAKVKEFKDRVTADGKAVSFYSNYRLSDGRNLPPQVQREYAMNAAVLNAVLQYNEVVRTARKSTGNKVSHLWENATAHVNSVRAEFNHSLPSKQVPLKRKAEKYQAEGYMALISGKYCNDNSRKVSDELEALIMALYAMPNKPYATDVHSMYHLFLNGTVQPVNVKTGEVYNPEDFKKNGVPLVLGETTIRNYLSQPANQVVLSKVRDGAHHHSSFVRPHHHRHAPNYSFSKITLDDRDLPRKCVNGKRVKAYYAIDVASGCFIGYAYSFDKDEALFLNCLKNMFRLINSEGWRMPLEVEVENHLVNKFFDDLALMFPFVRICNPGNSQEKRAEHFIRAKKYQQEHRTQTGIGRHYLKGDSNRVDRDKKNDEFVERMYTYEVLVADDLQTIQAHNSQLHPKQKKYPGKTRWQVLLDNMNPDAAAVDKVQVYKSIGHVTRTSVRRSQYVTVQGSKFSLPSADTLAQLKPGSMDVEAYYLPDADGQVNEVYIWQGDVFVAECRRIIPYNESKAESTAADLEAFTNQQKYVSHFDKVARDGKAALPAIAMLETASVEKAMALPVETIEEAVQITDTTTYGDNDFEDYAARALDNL